MKMKCQVYSSNFVGEIEEGELTNKKTHFKSTC